MTTLRRWPASLYRVGSEYSARFTLANERTYPCLDPDPLLP